MAIRNDNLGGSDWAAGDLAKAADLNDTIDAMISKGVANSLGAASDNLVRELQDRTVDFSGNGGSYGEAYIDSDGRLDSVDTTNTTATFDTDSYNCLENTTAEYTTHEDSNPTATNLTNAFDNDDSSYATIEDSGVSIPEAKVGKTFTGSKYINKVYYHIEMGNRGDSGCAGKFSIQTYDGSSWTDHTIIRDTSCDRSCNGKNKSGWVTLDNSYEGIRLYVKSCNYGSGQGYVYIYEFKIYENRETEVYHNIPSGTFSSTMSSAYGKVMYNDYEDGVSVQYRLIDFDFSKVNQNSYIEIVADSISSEDDFAINNCVITKSINGNWFLCSYESDDEIARAKLYKTLFYGTNGSNARASSTYITNITALKTSVSRDIGKRGYYKYLSDEDSSTTTGTFSNTSSNTAISSWSYLHSSRSDNHSRWYLPSGTLLHEKVYDDSNTEDEIGTDLTADEYDNASDCKIDVDGDTSYGASWGKVIVLSKASLSWSDSLSSSGTQTEIDFYTDNSIPELSTASTIPSSPEQDSGWLTENEVGTFTAFTVEPTTCIIKLIPKTTSPTAGYPSIKGYGVYEL